MSDAITTFQKNIKKALADHYRTVHSEATKRGIQAARTRKKLPTGGQLLCKPL